MLSWRIGAVTVTQTAFEDAPEHHTITAQQDFGRAQEQKPAADRRKPWGAPREKRDVVVEYRRPGRS